MRQVKKELYLPKRQLGLLPFNSYNYNPVYRVKWDVSNSVRDQIRVAIDFHIYKAN